MKNSFKALFIAVLLVGGISNQANAQTSSLDDKACKKAGLTQKKAGSTFKCTKVGKKLVWQSAKTTTTTEKSNETVSQRNAKSSAQSYLRLLSFSRAGLIRQLEFEKYSTADATYGVDALNVDWNAQAAKSAKDYLKTMAFSRAGLVDQLIFEGFTQAQAEYGVGTTGL